MMVLPSLNRIIGVITPIWALIVATGTFSLYQYGNTSGSNALAPEMWPFSAGIARSGQNPILLVFLHPQCPCSNATVTELEKIAARTQSHLEITVVFLQPHGVASDWHQTPLWKRVLTLPGITVHTDCEGTVTQKFGVTTSGQALLYDAVGHLSFTGGLTAARGHEGDNIGCDIIYSQVRNASPRNDVESEVCSVFGCPLFQPMESGAPLRKDSR